MALDGREITDPPGGIHQPHEAIPHLGRESRAMLVFPLFKWPGGRNLEALEERPSDSRTTVSEMQRVNIDPAGGETDGGALNHDRIAGDFRFDDRQTLGQRMVGELGRGIRPKEVGEIVARELLPGIERETNQEGEMLARTKPHLLTSDGEQGGTTEAMQDEVVSHAISTRFIDSP